VAGSAAEGAKAMRTGLEIEIELDRPGNAARGISEKTPCRALCIPSPAYEGRREDSLCIT
jgi:hypothetical protein